MNGFFASVSVELLKARRSKVFWLTLLAVCFIPAMCALMLYVLMHPELADRLNMLKAKTQLMNAKAEWPFFFVMLSQVVSMGGVIIFGFVASWVFGREFTDRTVKDLLALPVSRLAIVASKFTAVFAWCAVLAAAMFVSGVLSGLAAGLPDWSARLMFSSAKIFFGTAFLTILLAPPVAFFAGYGRGYMAPLAFMITMMGLANLVGMTGATWRVYFPWLVPALYGGAVSAVGYITLPGFLAVLFTGAAGFAATYLHWQRADHK